jgi:membrane protein required for colicin V production
MFTWLDVIVAAIILIWGLVSLLRGLTRELLIALSWITAAVMTYFLWPQLQLTQDYIEPDVLALAAAGLVMLAGAAAAVAGQARLVLTVMSWTVLPLLAMLLWPSYRGNPLWSFFWVALIVTSLAVITLSKNLLAWRTGVTGRTLGFAFGAARGFIAVALAYHLAATIQPGDRMPHWVRDARSLPVIKAAGGTIVSLLSAPRKAPPG